MLVLRNEFRQRNGKAEIENTKEEGNRKIEVAISLVPPFVLNILCTCQARRGRVNVAVRPRATWCHNIEFHCSSIYKHKKII